RRNVENDGRTVQLQSAPKPTDPSIQHEGTQVLILYTPRLGQLLRLKYQLGIGWLDRIEPIEETLRRIDTVIGKSYGPSNHKTRAN
ncbi:hypothetical protein R0J89_19070, partial [Psychrobacter sp. SIMBA_152]